MNDIGLSQKEIDKFLEHDSIIKCPECDIKYKVVKYFEKI
jgi:predicted  nucleic acid-binding Zn-ribbon protein